MKDRIAGAPGQYSAVVHGGEYQKIQTGQPFSITLIRDDKPEVEGTPYSKAAVLPDKVANRLCPDLEDPSPADAFDALSKGDMPILYANPDTFLETIKNARPGTTIQLAAGNYPLLVLTGKRGLERTDIVYPALVAQGLAYSVTTYPENLTIVGGERVNLAGVSITSGVLNTEIDISMEGYSQYECCNTDISNAILPKGLTFRNVQFTKSVSLRNASVDDLSFINCVFENGAHLFANANVMKDEWGTEVVPLTIKDETGKEIVTTPFEERRFYAELMPKNMLVRECSFGGVKGSYYIGGARSAIQVRCIDGITLYKNTINDAEHNGIQIGGASTLYNNTRSTGKIYITNNTITNTGRNSVNVFGVDNATVIVSSNIVNSANLKKTTDPVHVRVDTMVTNTTVHCSENKHDKTDEDAISSDKINIVTSTTPPMGAAPAIESAEHPGCYYRTVNGSTEWINPPMVPGVEYRTTERFEDNPIYCQALSISALAANSTQVDLSSYGIKQTALIRYNGNVWNSNASHIVWLPCNEVSLFYELGAFYLKGNSIDITGYQATLRCYYIKQ